jgi:cation diffusion facilitator CzcD-associated flavoprotein CzcO
VALEVEADGRTAACFARRVVVATWPCRPRRPAPARLRRKAAALALGASSDDNDYAELRGLRVGVVGGGASAMDSAATALEAGAAHVHLLVRRADLPRINKGKGAGNPGFVQGYARLPDDWKWRIRHYINAQQVPPPRNSTQRVSRFGNAHFHLGAAIEAVERRAAPCRCAPRPDRSSSTS